MIRRVPLPGLGIEASCLGFGCASLGSRISARAGIDALIRAYDAGISWFDLAPAYGAGDAESIFSSFLASRRDRISILTKVGLAPPRRSPYLRAAYAAARPLLGLAQGLRKKARGLGATRNRSLVITPQLIETSIATSLSMLKTERVDVLALHDPEPETVLDEAVIRALQRVIERGQACVVGIAGSFDACLAGARRDLPYVVFQTAIRSRGDNSVRIREAAGRDVTVIGHSVFGVDGAKDKLVAKLRQDGAARGKVAAAGYDAANVEKSAATLLLDAALASNSDGVTLASMFAPAHLASNAARAEGPVRHASGALLRELLQAGVP
jgi:aryl-alcohol dehydrogenase-like predicted oxidoreductase